MREFNAKLVDIAHANVDEAFDFAHEIVSVQTPSDFMSIWSNHTKRRFEMMTEQMQELSEMGKKIASRHTAPGLSLVGGTNGPARNRS
jgi:hypothetical protein